MQGISCACGDQIGLNFGQIKATMPFGVRSGVLQCEEAVEANSVRTPFVYTSKR